jgi:hypothetical protein
MEKEKEQGIVLPTVPRKATAVNLRNLLIYGKEKSGKTTACSQLPNSLLIDVEDGAEFVTANVMQPPPAYERA